LPQSAGASLVVVYRDPAQPLRKIVLYDGVYVQPSLNVSTTFTLRGFYLSAVTSPPAQLTHIFASGPKNTHDRLYFNDSPAGDVLMASDPFPNAKTSSDRAWASPTIDVTSQMSSGNNTVGGFGETATTTVNHSGGGPYDCITWAATIF